MAVTVQSFFIGLLVVGMVGLMLFTSARDVSSLYGETIADEYVQTYGFAESKTLSTDFAKQTPGGIDFLPDTQTAQDVVDSTTLSPLSTVTQATGAFKNMVSGTDTNKSITNKLYIEGEWTTLLIAVMMFILAIVLLGAFLRNRL